MFMQPTDLGAFALLVTGPPLSLKTTVASRLSLYLRASLIESACLGSYPGQEATRNRLEQDIEKKRAKTRSRRHENMIALAGLHLRLGTSFILDSAYSRRERRQRVYKTVLEHEECDLNVVYCHCDDTAVFEHRFNHRTENRLSPEPNSTDMEFLQELRSEYEPPVGTLQDEWNGQRIEVIDFDTAKWKIEVHPGPPKVSLLASTIVEFLNYEVAIGDL